ncbi:hypothetical protein BK765_28690 [Bacillus thuringiensis serovar dakota]|nr:hypothetical protein BK765_28690 [Bacillus thuringiensis serovar dakota]
MILNDSYHLVRYGNSRDNTEFWLLTEDEKTRCINNKCGSYKSKVVALTENEKGLYNVNTLGGSQKNWFLTEDGIYM